MGIYQQISGSLAPLHQGGVSREILERISALEQKVSAIENTKSSETKYGLTILSNAEDVTETGNGAALSAVQNNAAVEGTLANKIEKNKFKVITVETSDITLAPNGFRWGSVSVEVPEGYEGTDLITWSSPNGIFIMTAAGYGNGIIQYGFYNTRASELTEREIIRMLVIKKGLNI